MAVIHLFNGGEMGSPRCVGKMYPREIPCPDDRFDAIDIVKYLGKAWLSRTINTCDCTITEAIAQVKGDECACLEVGDVLNMVLAPGCMILDGVAWKVTGAVEGVTFNLIQAEVDCTDLGANPVTLGVIDASPLPVPPFDPNADPCVRLPLDQFCEDCGGMGNCGYFPSLAPAATLDVSDAQDGSVLIPAPAVHMPAILQVPQMFYLEVATLPEGFECTRCCLEVTISVGLEDPWQGN